MGEAVATLVSISTAPVPVCVLSVAVLRERLTGAIDGALASALIGKVLLIGVGRQGTARQVSSSAGGILLSLGAAFNFDVFILVSRLLANRYHPLPSITIAVSIGALLVMTVAGVSAGITVRYSAATWALFLYLGLVPTALGHALLPGGAECHGFGGERRKPGRTFDFDGVGCGHLRGTTWRLGAARRCPTDQRHRFSVPEWPCPVRRRDPTCSRTGQVTISSAGGRSGVLSQILPI